jgi:hypothetical protein
MRTKLSQTSINNTKTEQPNKTVQSRQPNKMLLVAGGIDLEPATINVSKPAAVSVPPMTKHQRYI